jgi:hypothetical protein
MAYLNMIAVISIGQVQFNDINSFKIEQSITEISDNATIVIPRNYAKLKGVPVKDLINVGDEVIIEAGYEETGTAIEFTGYVKEISSDIPIEITCDEVYPFRKSNLVKSYKTVTLRQLLEDVVSGIKSFNGDTYKVECPDVNLGKYLIDNASAFQVLSKLKQDFGFYSRIYGNVLHVGLAYDWKPSYTKKHTYRLQENVKNKSNLKFKAVSDFNTQVKVTIKHPNGTTETVTAGSLEEDAAVKTITTGAMTKADAEKLAKSRLKQYTYNGYTGSITGFGIPRVNAGDSIEITDQESWDRTGTYLVEKVGISYSDSGFERESTISFKV